MNQGFLFLVLTLMSISVNGTTLEDALNHFNAAQYERALSEFEALAKKNDDPHINYYLARSYFHEGRLELARKVFAENVTKYPTHANSHFLLGSVTLTLVSDANIFRKFGLAKQALASWHQAAELDGNNIEFLYGLASFYLNAPSIAGGDPEKAQKYIDKISNLSEPYAKLIMASKIRKKEEKGSARKENPEKESPEQLIKGAIQEIPERAFPILILADYYYKEKRFEEALTETNNYRKRRRTWNDPGIAQTAILAGRIYRELGNPSQAKIEFNRALNSKTHHNFKKLAKKELKTL
ncbi:MAG: tetratricopeptide (TPR) repeat protein [Flavobacterium sp.]|jgi:tetratricopeptide (TPR) repeat protein